MVVVPPTTMSVGMLVMVTLGGCNAGALKTNKSAVASNPGCAFVLATQPVWFVKVSPAAAAVAVTLTTTSQSPSAGIVPPVSFAALPPGVASTLPAHVLLTTTLL